MAEIKKGRSRRFDAGPVEKSDWRKREEAMAYLGVGRNYLDKVAQEAGAKSKVGGRAFYNIRLIEDYLNNSVV